NQSCGGNLAAADPHLAGRRIGKMLDFLDALPQVIEHGAAPLQQRGAIACGLDSLRGAIEETHTDRVFQIGNCLGYGRLGNRQLYGSFPHAALAQDGHEHVQVAQPEPPANPRLPLGGFAHEYSVMGTSNNTITTYGSPAATVARRRSSGSRTACLSRASA